MEDGETAQEALAKRHRREKKDQQGKIQSMKNAVPKNDKKRRKQLGEEVAKMEADMSQRHQEEVQQLDATGPQSKVEEVVNGVEDLGLGREEEEEEKDSKLSRTTKAQKRRDRKAAEERERESRIAEAEVENLSGLRHQERLALALTLAQSQLQIRDIPSDGHCLYRAVEDQLSQRGVGGAPQGLKELRSLTARHMRDRQDHFLPFLTNATTGEMYSPEEFEKYCSDVAETAAWGGQLELTALSQVLQLPLQVIQCDCPTLTIGEEFHQPPITLVYMRHAYGLGEHYNSVERLKEHAVEDDDS